MTEPLIVFDQYNAVLETAERALDPPMQLKLLSAIIQNGIPIGFRVMLERLLMLLKKIHMAKSSTRMDAHNLGVVFAPQILRSQFSDPLQMFVQADFCVGAVEFMIEHVDCCGLFSEDARWAHIESVTSATSSTASSTRASEANDDAESLPVAPAAPAKRSGLSQSASNVNNPAARLASVMAGEMGRRNNSGGLLSSSSAVPSSAGAISSESLSSSSSSSTAAAPALDGSGKELRLRKNPASASKSFRMGSRRSTEIGSDIFKNPNATAGEGDDMSKASSSMNDIKQVKK